jgi:hypothetical protein
MRIRPISHLTSLTTSVEESMAHWSIAQAGPGGRAITSPILCVLALLAALIPLLGFRRASPGWC